MLRPSSIRVTRKRQPPRPPDRQVYRPAWRMQGSARSDARGSHPCTHPAQRRLPAGKQCAVKAAPDATPHPTAQAPGVVFVGRGRQEEKLRRLSLLICPHGRLDPVGCAAGQCRVVAGKRSAGSSPGSCRRPRRRRPPPWHGPECSRTSRRRSCPHRRTPRHRRRLGHLTVHASMALSRPTAASRRRW